MYGTSHASFFCFAVCVFIPAGAECSLYAAMKFPFPFPSLSTSWWAIIACLLWSTAFVGVKIGLSYSDPFSFAGIRFMLAGLLLIPFWWQRRPSWKRVRENGRVIFLVSFFQTFLVYGLFYMGMTMVSGAIAAILIGASPLTAALVAHFMGKNDTMTGRRSLALVLGMAGVVLLSVSTRPWVSPGGMSEFVGIVLLFFCTVASGLGNVLVAGERSDMDPVFFNSLQIFFGGCCLLFVAWCMGHPIFRSYPMPYYLSLIWLSLLSAAAFSIWFILLRRPGIKVSSLNIWKFLIPVFGAGLSWIFLPGEDPNLSSLVGMVLIAGSILLYYLWESRGAAGSI
jgi:drug/metabolite transporter (DMT)-like permease